MDVAGGVAGDGVVVRLIPYIGETAHVLPFLLHPERVISAVGIQHEDAVPGEAGTYALEVPAQQGPLTEDPIAEVEGTGEVCRRSAGLEHIALDEREALGSRGLELGDIVLLAPGQHF